MDRGKIIIKLDEYLKVNNFSRSRLSRDGGIRYETILGYCRSTVTRFDIDTLFRICSTLDCQISDIIEFIPNKD